MNFLRNLGGKISNEFTKCVVADRAPRPAVLLLYEATRRPCSSTTYEHTPHAKLYYRTRTNPPMPLHTLQP